MMNLLLPLLLCSVGKAFSPLTSYHAKKRTTLYGQSGDDNPIATQSFLSHAMLRIPHIDKTVKYWTEKGGTIRIQKEKPSGGLSSAMIELGCTSKEQETSFALELVETNTENYQLGNALSYIGVSMLLQFQNNLVGAIEGIKPKSEGKEPNGITVRSSASAPGDFLARFALRTNDLDKTEEFYTSVLGMENKARDEKMLCLRYDNDCFTGGVPTTLVFDRFEDDLEIGDCFDHIVIATKTNVNDVFDLLTEQECKIFMKPTKMFGKDVMGLIDPNGYKVILASC